MPASYISPRFQAIDEFGNPLIGGKLYTYINTTTTPRATYQDSAGTTANTNPIVLDARGEAVIFLSVGMAYTFVLRDDSGALVWSQDSISSAAGSASVPSFPTPPSVDVGSPVYIDTIGWANWDGTKYVSDYTRGFGGQAYSFRNKVINGDFRRWQRGPSVGPIVAASGTTFTADRWSARVSGTASITVSQLGTAANYGQGGTGAFYAHIVSNASAVPGANDKNRFSQPIQGANLLQVGLGSIYGGYFTVSFWAFSSIPGTYSIAFLNGGSPLFRSYVANFTINTANNSEFKKITVPVDQSTTNNWNIGNDVGMSVIFDLGSGAASEGALNTWSSSEATRTSGSVRIIGVLGATFGINNVQLECGTQATPFEVVDDQTLKMRTNFYYQVIGATSFFGYTNAGGATFGSPFSFSGMRVPPAVSYGTLSYSNAANATALYITANTITPIANSVAAGPCALTIGSMNLNAEL